MYRTVRNQAGYTRHCITPCVIWKNQILPVINYIAWLVSFWALTQSMILLMFFAQCTNEQYTVTMPCGHNHPFTYLLDQSRNTAWYYKGDCRHLIYCSWLWLGCITTTGVYNQDGSLGWRSRLYPGYMREGDLTTRGTSTLLAASYISQIKNSPIYIIVWVPMAL